jgi:hypothetical protein
MTELLFPTNFGVSVAESRLPIIGRSMSIIDACSERLQSVAGSWNMRPPRTGEAATSRAKWTMDVRSTVQAALVGALVVFLFALLHQGPEAVKWPLVQGDIHGHKNRC